MHLMAFCVVLCDACVTFWESTGSNSIIIIFDMCLYVNYCFKLASLM